MKQHNFFAAALMSAMLLVGCGSDDAKPDVNSAASGQCGAPAVSDATAGGCRIRLVTPKPCETIDLSAGKQYEFAWTTDGTFCETPFNLYIGGNPINVDTGENIFSWSYSKNAGYVSNYGGIAYYTADQLAEIVSKDGTFQWTVASYHGSRPGSVVFRINK